MQQLPQRQWYGYQVWAGDDTKVHRNSKHVWGVCSFHEYTARCPNRASTVRAHNWVVVGALLPQSDGPACFLPQAASLYFRKSQLPQGEEFRTKPQLLVELYRRQAQLLEGKHLAVFDGGFALASVVRPLALPGPGQQRIEFLTRLRKDARLFALPPDQKRKGKRGPKPKWGRRLPAPRCGGRWPGKWREAEVYLYGQKRKVRWKEVVCLWKVSGHQIQVKAVVAKVEGYRKRFLVVSSALELSGLQLVELFAARFRQEDGFRDLKQRLGWEECRAWTKQPIQRTTQAVLVTLSLLRLLEFRLEAEGEGDWWTAPPWYPNKQRPSVADAQRLLWRHAGEIRQHLSALLEKREEAWPAPAQAVAI